MHHIQRCWKHSADRTAVNAPFQAPIVLFPDVQKHGKNYRNGMLSCASFSESIGVAKKWSHREWELTACTFCSSSVGIARSSTICVSSETEMEGKTAVDKTAPATAPKKDLRSGDACSVELRRKVCDWLTHVKPSIVGETKASTARIREILMHAIVSKILVRITCGHNCITYV